MGAVIDTCARCSRACSQQIVRLQRWFTLFFIPIFPFHTRYVAVCSMCSNNQTLDRTHAEQMASRGDQGPSVPPPTGEPLNYGSPEVAFAPPPEMPPTP
jgi:hypothetical protein